MKKILMILMVVAFLAVVSQAFAIDTNVLAVVQDGKLRVTGTYFAFGGQASVENPAFENRYIGGYFATGSAGFAQENSFARNISVKEQFEVSKGSGRFETKVGTGVLVNIPREPVEGEAPATVPIVDGTLRVNAAGFGGGFSNTGIVLSTFSTANGLVAKSEAEGTGKFLAGAIQRIETGSNQQPIQPPITVEYQEAHWQFNGKFQAKIEIVFPK